MAKNKESFCNREKTYTSALELTEDTWKCAKKDQKIRLLKSLGMNTSFAKTKSIHEMLERGGGLPANAILQLNRRFIAEKGGKVTVKWDQIKK